MYLCLPHSFCYWLLVAELEDIAPCKAIAEYVIYKTKAKVKAEDAICESRHSMRWFELGRPKLFEDGYARFIMTFFKTGIDQVPLVPTHVPLLTIGRGWQHERNHHLHCVEEKVNGRLH
jgi:hypothetical protein